MKTFVDTQKYSSRSLLVYGNLTDRYIDSDLVLRNFDQYLVKLLKDRGWEHIIFYGSDNNRGAYCLDPESARFFFPEGNGGAALPAKHEPGQKPSKPDKADKAQPEPVQAEPAKKKPSILDRYRSKGYKPGMKPGQPAKEEPKEEPKAPPQQDAAPPQEITYRLDWVLDEFVRTVSPMMQRRDNRMAVVFYNILSTELNKNPRLIDNLLNQWDMTDNLCLLLAPGTQDHTNNLMHVLQEYNLHDKFVVRHGQHDLRPNPRTSFYIGMPGVDEVEYLLRRLALMGTRRGRRISLPFSQMKETAEAILNCISQHIASRGDTPVTTLTTNYLIDALSDVIDQHPGRGPVPLDAAMIKRLFPVSEEEKDSLEAFHRPGWEAAYEKMKEVAIRAKKDFADRKAPERDEKPDWSIMRTEMEQYVTVSHRPKVPNFLILGNPGTGKTEIGRKIARLLYDLGYIRTSGMREVTREQLTSRYVNGTAEETRARVDEAEEQVLFLDEAHSLGNHDGGHEREDSGKAVVQELNSCLTNPNRHFSLVMAGYREPMKAVFKLDPGFSRRITYTIHIDDYEPDLLRTILQERILSSGCTIDPELLTPIDDAPDHVTPFDCMVRRIYRERDRVNFGNAGAMVELATRVCGRTDDDNVVRREHFYPEGYNDDWFRCSDLDNTLEGILKEFRQRFVGMENIQELLCRLHRTMIDKLARGQSAEDVKLPSLILAGNPGTGKTSVCEMLARMYFGMQVLGTPEIVTFKLHDRLRAREELQEAIEEAQARKALLMIDEAHQLAEAGLSGTLSTLMAPMTDKKHPFMVVLCCYRTLLENVLAEDDGLMRRFEEPVILEDYTGEELHQIFHKAMKNDDPRFHLTPEADQLLRDVLDYVYNTRSARTGNAGFVVDKLLHGAMNDLRVKRCMDQGIDLASDESLCFTEEDIPAELIAKLPPPDEKPETVCEQILAEMEQRFIGMAPIRSYLYELTDRVVEAQHRDQPVSLMEVPALLLCGPSGTGKTSIAAFLAWAYEKLHLVGTAEPITVSASQLLSPHSNMTHATARRQIDLALEKNALLVVDNCQQLCERSTTGAEALQPFTEVLGGEKCRLRVVFCLPQEDKDDFLRLDSGLVGHLRQMTFADFSGQDLFAIFEIMARREDLTIEQDVLDVLRRYCDHLHLSRTKTFDNAFAMQRLLQTLHAALMQRRRTQGIAYDAPAYRCITMADMPEDIARQHAKASADGEMDRLMELMNNLEEELAGYDGICDIIREKITALVFNLRYPEYKTVVEPGHYFFLGNAGTGKTTAAEKLAEYFHRIGLTSKPGLQKHSGPDLLGQYLGETTQKVENLLSDALGGVMLIDEAYALADGGREPNSYKRDAIAKLIAFLDDERMRRVSCVIFAGYEEDMETLYAANQGMRSRVRPVGFPDFSLENCLAIFQRMLRKENRSLDENALPALEALFRIVHDRPNFANGRDVRHLKDLCVQKMVYRCVHSGGIANVILAEDIPSAAEAMQHLNAQ